jgi:WD40 repeat protein
LLGHTDDLTAATFAPDGRLLATASLDGTVRIWDVRRGAQLRALPLPATPRAVAFSRDGTRIAVGDARGDVRVIDACPGCLDPRQLLALARRQVTRGLTPVERRTFLGAAAE